MKILAIIITYNSEKWIDKNISSIFQQDFVGDVLVIDNGSEDKTLDIVKSKFPQVRIIESGENLGFAKANNLGFEIAKKEHYDYVFLVNHDGWLLPDFWNHVLPVLSHPNYEDYGLLSPVHLDSTEIELDYGFRKYAGDALEKNSDNVIEIDFINGAFLFISRKCLKEIKGFDPVFFFYGEDIDLCLRVKKRGYKIGVFRVAKVVHDRKERILTDDRVWNHLVASYLIQLKSIRGGFYKSFLKTNYSIFTGYFHHISNKKQRKNYIKLFFYLWRNKSRIKNAYYTFN